MAIGDHLTSKKHLPIIIVLAILVGTFWFRVIDKASLNPGNISWVFCVKDTAQHYIGWEFFRNESWTFPIGKIQTYGYPYGTSLNFTDSIPLAGIFFKLLNPFLPHPFQYFGIWLWACFILQAFFSLLILVKFTSSRTAAVLGASLLLLSPNMLVRMDVHTSLASHWLILWGIYLLFEGRDASGKISWQWPVLFTCASLVHFYFLPITLALFCVYLIEVRLNGRRYRDLIIELGLNLVVIFAINGIAGNFNLNGADLNIGGLGDYSMNLDALFNPDKFSRFLKGLPVVTQGQIEGYNYLGLGNIILLAWSILLVAQNLSRIRLRQQEIAIVAACLALSLIAVSNRITLWNRTLLVIPLPETLEKLAGIFRSTGRFFWPVFYILVVSMLIFFLAGTRSKPANMMLIMIVFAQLVDITPLIRYVQTPTACTWKTPLKSGFWDQVPSYFTQVVIYPAEYSLFIDNYEPIAHLAAANHLTLNAGYMARWPGEAMQQYAETAFDQAIAGQIDPRQLFVIVDPKAVARIQNENLVVLSVDKFILMLSRNNLLLNNWPDWIKFEMNP